MRAGSLRHIIQIMYLPAPDGSDSDPDLLTNDLLEPIEEWAQFAVVRASKEPAYGKEYTQFQQVQTELSVKFRIRYLDGVTAEMRVVCDGKIHEIVMPPIDVEGMKREMLLMCSEVSSDQD